MNDIKDGDILLIENGYGFNLVKIVGKPSAVMMTASTWRSYGGGAWDTPSRRNQPHPIRKVPPGSDPHRIAELAQASCDRRRAAREIAEKQHRERLDKIAPIVGAES